MSERLGFRVLGPLRLLRGDRSVELGRPKQRAVLARLLLSGNRVVSVDRLVEDLWGEGAPARSDASLQAYVSNLRHILEPNRTPRTPATRLVTQPPGYLVVVADDELDASRFERLAARAAAQLDEGDPDVARRTASHALGLWSGTFLADFADEAFTRADRMRYTELQQATLETRLAAELEIGMTAPVIGELEGLVSVAPLRERPWELLMLALHRAGRSADALERYQRVRRLLADEVGLEPGPGLRRLQDGILRQDESLVRPAARPPAAAVAPPTAAPEPRPAPTSAAPFVGRQSECDHLDAEVAAAAAGRTSWAIVAGEAGIGKSRLVEVVAARAVDLDARVLWARCHQEEDAPPFWVALQLLRGLAPDVPVHGGLAERLGVPVSDADGEELRFRLYDAVARELRSEAGRGPLIAIVDDLQWADRASLRLLAFLAVELRDVPLIVLATVRDEPLASEVEALLATVARHPGASRVDLHGLAVAELAELSVAVTGHPLAADAVGLLHERTGGNAFFGSELLRLYATIDGLPASSVPSGVRGVVRRRLEQLPSDARSLLVLAAILGLEFDLQGLAAAGGIGLDETADQLDLALARRILVPADELGARFRFAHALMRDAVLADLTVFHRQRLHARVAASLQAGGGGQPAQLAHHLLEAGPLGPWPVAAKAAEVAGRHAADRFAFDEAAAWFERALAAYDAGGGADHATHHRLLLAAGECYRDASMGPQARETLVTAMDRAEAVGDADGMARAGALIGRTQAAWFWALFTEQPREVLDRIERALARLPDEDSPARAGLLTTYATGLLYFPSAEAARADALSADALAMARRVGDPRTLAETLMGRIEAIWHARHVREQLALCDELLAGPPEGRALQVELAARALRCQALVHVGRLAAADEEYERTVALATQRRQVSVLAQVSWYRAARAVIRWDENAAVAASAHGTALHEAAQLQLGSEIGMFNRLELLREQGGLTAAEPMIAHMSGVATEVPRVRMPWFEYFLHLHLARGDHDALRDGLRETLAGEPPFPWLWLAATWLRADAAASLDDPEIAAAFAAMLEPYRDLVPMAGTGMLILPPVALALGRLELVLEDPVRAAASLRTALETAERFAAPAWMARTNLNLGAALLAADPAAAEARARLDAAASGGRRLGLRGVEAEASRLLAGGHAGPPAAA